jgi:hypothetical protein
MAAQRARLTFNLFNRAVSERATLRAPAGGHLKNLQVRAAHAVQLLQPVAGVDSVCATRVIDLGSTCSPQVHVPSLVVAGRVRRHCASCGERAGSRRLKTHTAWLQPHVTARPFWASGSAVLDLWWPPRWSELWTQTAVASCSAGARTCAAAAAQDRA